MSLADTLLAKEEQRKETVKLLLVKAVKTAKEDYEEATVWKIDTGRYLMVEGKILDKEWWNSIVISYLAKLAQKLVEKGDIGVY